ncbi:cytochrome c family protein [Planctomicrobium sp.]|jgi:hypothetical protein|nr:cytochrome c family protein [Planctomicrobium sp.]
MKSAISIAVLITMNAGLCLAEDIPGSIPRAGSLTDPSHMLGLIRGDCKKCHPSEVAAWMKSTHFLSADLRLYMNSANTKKYADALKIEESQLLTTSVCADCHGTKAIKDSNVSVISGVSCEKCHGGSGGDSGWLNRHQSYHTSLIVPRTSETKEHRTERLQDCDQAGMVRSSNIYGLAKTCYSCHLVNNEELVAAGHKLASAFEFVSWSEGEVRHNFLLNRNENAEAPSIWLERTGRSVQERRRLKFVLGTLAQLEIGLRTRADAKSPILIPQIGGMIAAANGKLMQVNGVAPTEEVLAVTMIVLPLMGTLFAPLPNDAETYNAAADKIAGYAKQFAEKQTGENLSALDALISATPPHFSQQFKDKYLVPAEDK